ncbi:MAG: 2-oxoglutarate dehydrogenase complex dihydrolipoyllysine-residue succinyltransferase [Desulfuromonadales bacterium]
MEIRIPTVGESIHEALLAAWRVADGASVQKDEVLCDLETDKVNIEVTAEVSGTVKIAVPAGETLPVGSVIGTIEPGDAPEKETPEKETPEKETPEKETPEKETPEKETPEKEVSEKEVSEEEEQPAINPAAARLARERQIDLSAVAGTGRDGRITVEDVQAAAKASQPAGEDGQKTGRPAREEPPEPAAKTPPARQEEGSDGRPVTREPMSPLRQRIAARLLAVRQQTAMLTTFNEADLTRLKTLRVRHQEQFTGKHGIKLGLMSFFVKACIEALKANPAVNARIDGSDIVYHHYYDIGIAVGTDRGLVVPVLRDADRMTFAEIEKKIAELARKANDRKLTLAELEGGTFTISNGGIYGSLLSTPILNPPQTGVLGMHAIQERPVAMEGQVVIRPMMYLALSYDHRLIDGREAVGFLKLIKEYLEDPEELLLEL